MSIHKYRDRTRGAAVVDYLITTAIVVGFSIPIVLKYFGEPMLATLTNQRQSLVGFLAQNAPRKTLPPEWFRVESQGRTGGNGQLSNPKPIQAGNVQAGDLGTPGNITAGAPGNPGQLSAQNLKDPGQLSVGNGSGGGGGGPGALGGANGAGGAGGDSSFFGGGGDGGGSGKGGADTAGEKSGPLYGKGGGGGAEETEEFGSGAAGAKKGAEKGQEDKASKEGDAGSARKKQQDAIARAEREIEHKKKPFDWWLLIKFLIVLLIAFLLIVIALGNARRG